MGTIQPIVQSWRLHQPWLKTSGGGQPAVGLDPINEGVQPDVLQRGWAGMARQRSKSQDDENCYMECEQVGKSIG